MVNVDTNVILFHYILICTKNYQTSVGRESLGSIPVKNVLNKQNNEGIKIEQSWIEIMVPFPKSRGNYNDAEAQEAK